MKRGCVWWRRKKERKKKKEEVLLVFPFLFPSRRLLLLED